MKKYLIALVIVILLIIIAGAVYLKLNNSTVPNQVACTMEAKICPDGSAVGRQGPKCEFEECPFTPDAIDETAGWKTYTNEKYGFEFKYPKDFFITQEGNWPGEVHYLDVSKLKIAPPKEFPGLRIVIGDFSEDLKSWINERTKDSTEENSLYEAKVDEIIVDGIRGYKTDSKVYHVVYLRKEGKLFSLVNTLNDQVIFNQILSTFKFTK